ncbi:DUF368 domain-containing protein [Balneolaceae bacterium ANBcel3]|nr:DUF368 domain-containing protein [Balneolaceae bacterium ANBcel3]
MASSPSDTENHEKLKESRHTESSQSSGEVASAGFLELNGDPEKDKTTIREMPSLALKGFVMGSADVIPGVSGGTMALVLGIYTRLVFAIRSVDPGILRQFIMGQWSSAIKKMHTLFLISIFVGGVSAVFFFTKVVKLPVLMHTHPEVIYGLFFGLISGSIVLLFRAVDTMGWKEWGTVILGTLTGFRVVTLVPVDTPETSLFVFFSGALSITAMILPGISGSFILLILRKYDYILSHIALLGTDRTIEAFWVLVPFGLGMAFGLFVFVRVLSWLLKRYRMATICLLMGFMAGSLYVIWPYQEQEYREITILREVPAMDEEVLELRAATPDRELPEYTEFVRILNPEAPPEAQIAELADVRRRLIKSRPFWPDWIHPEADNRLERGKASIYQGIGLMIAGILLVLYIGRRMNTRTSARSAPTTPRKDV